MKFDVDTPIRAAFLTRATNALRRIAANADEASLTAAVAAPTDEGALARAVADAAPSAGPLAELDPLAALFARGAEQKLELANRAGGLLPVSEVAKFLGISRQAVDKRRREGRLLAVPRGADHAYPACQFTEDGVTPGLPEVLRALGPSRGWGALAFLVSSDAEQLGGATPLAALASADPGLGETVLRLARGSSADGFG